MMKKRLTAFILSLLFVLVPLSGCTTTTKTSTQGYEKTIQTARTEIWKELGSGTSSSATVAIMDNGKLVYTEGFAMADRVAALTVTENTQFNIGSVSKVFTAAAVMQLVEEKKLELDKPVVDYLPDFTMADSRYKDITVRMLLNHTSGLPGTMMGNGFASTKDPKFLTEFMAYLAGSGLKADPGVVSVYCNDGFMLAEVLIELVSGQSYDEYMKQHIFSKSGMKDSSCSFIEGNKNIALKYSSDNGQAMPAEIINLMGTGGISSTPADLCRFGNALITNKLMSAESFTEYTSAQYGNETVPSGTPITNYGLGWDMVDVATFAEQGVHVVSKNGGTLQFNSQLYVIPDAKLSIALIFAGSGDASGIASTITQTLLEEKGIVQAAAEMAPTATPVAIPNDLLEFAGYYGASGSAIKIEFNQQSNTLEYKRFDGNSFVPTGSYPYIGNGYFDMQNDYKMSFSNSFGKKLVLQTMNSADYSLVIAQGISANNPIDTSHFAGKTWLLISLPATDLYAFSAVTGSLPELPGTIYYGSDGAFTPYPLKDENTGYMNLPYARDLVEPTITEENGKTTMQAMNYLFLDAADVPVLGQDEKITIEKAGENVIRKLAADGSFSVTLPEAGRLIIFDPTSAVEYDTLYTAIEDVPVTAGSYLMFIGNQSDPFTYQYSF